MNKGLAVALCMLAWFVGPGVRSAVLAQEFDCRVSVDYAMLTGNDYTFLNDLTDRIDEYINRRVWTQHRFEDVERIDCTIQVTIEEAPTLTSFKGRLVVATRRPIYGTMQSSTVVQFNDADWEFNYAQGMPLNFDLERYDPLTSVLDFYAFVMLGYDFDTFSELGGTPYFEQARRIAQRAVERNAAGWTQLGNEQTRYQLITQLLDPRFKPLREAYFTYHFSGLDRFVRETESARQSVLQVLTNLASLREELSRTYAGDVFFSSKYQEITGIFMDAPDKSIAYSILSQADPAHMTEYNRLTQ